MILFAFHEQPETRPNMPCSAFRWTFQVGAWTNPVVRGIFAGFVHQHQLKGVWYSSHTTTYEVSLTTKFALGQEHIYYDGPHCMLDLGFLHIQWINRNCKRCMGD